MRWPPWFVLGGGVDRAVVVLCIRGVRGKVNIHGLCRTVVLRFREKGYGRMGKGRNRDIPVVRFRYYGEVKHRGRISFLGLGLLCCIPVAFLFRLVFLDRLI
ncbi:hypothetical protein E4U59_007395 [Claviceps monticola]|nr:hypothetical protein E4U59_007395 [Claviceps monticola]